MEKIKILDIDNDGMNLATDEQYLYMRCNRAMYKYYLLNNQIVAEKSIFKKDGKARGFAIFKDLIFLYGFLDLYILSKYDLEAKVNLRLGENLSSDICEVMWVESSKAYVKIRNGWIYVLDINTSKFDKTQVSDVSFWSDCVTEDCIYAGTVNGELLEIDKRTLEVARKVRLCKKNIYSIVYEDGLLYTTSQDQTIKIVDTISFETVCVAKKAVTGMANIIGVYKDILIVAGERNPLSIWDKKTLQLRGTIDFPQNRNSIIRGNILYGSDRKSVYKMIM